MDTTLVIIVGAYVFFESATAINEMPRLKLRNFWHDFTNYYALKYLAMGFYGLMCIYYARSISGWAVLLTVPAVFCVVRRTLFRIRRYIQIRKLELSK